MVLVYCAGATVVQCWRSAAIGKVHVTGTVRVHVTGMVRMHTGNTATHPRQCGTNGTPVRGRQHAAHLRQCGARTMQKQVAQ